MFNLNICAYDLIFYNDINKCCEVFIEEHNAFALL